MTSNVQNEIMTLNIRNQGHKFVKAPLQEEIPSLPLSSSGNKQINN